MQGCFHLINPLMINEERNEIKINKKFLRLSGRIFD